MRRVMLFIAVAAFAYGGAHAFTLTIAATSDAVSLSTHATNDQPSARVMRQIYDTLIVQTEELELVPGLAESWTQIDELAWEFNIRPGVTFHNGDPLTAGDVVYTLNSLRDPAVAAPGAFILGFLDTVEEVDDLTVRLTTRTPFAPLLSHLAHTATSILNETVVAEAGEDYGTAVVVGTGPFKFVSWEVASQIVLERNDDWWGGEVLPERVVFRPITEGTVRAIEVEAGGVDIAYELQTSPRDAVRAMQNPNLITIEIATLSTSYVGFNVQKEPFDDVRVRQAINHAVDVEPMIDAILEGFGGVATSPISDMVFGANLELEPYEYDTERARQLLADAGYPDGFSTTLWTNDNPVRIQIAEILQALLADVGISVDVQVLEWSTYLSDTAAGAHDMFILGWNTVTADADYGLYALFHSSNFGSAGNRTFWATPRLDELLDLGRSESDPELRVAYYREAQEIIAEEAPWVFLYLQTEVYAMQENVTGFVPHPAGHHRLYNVSKN
jgi:peptide/nickel transport system substrate-binding protein